jgi:hypothetical protein
MTGPEFLAFPRDYKKRLFVQSSILENGALMSAGDARIAK